MMTTKRISGLIDLPNYPDRNQMFMFDEFNIATINKLNSRFSHLIDDLHDMQHRFPCFNTLWRQ